MESAETAGHEPAAPVGVNHIVLNVRNMDESHQFWTEIVGLRLAGEFRQRPGRPPNCQNAVLQWHGDGRCPSP